MRGDSGRREQEALKIDGQQRFADYAVTSSSMRMMVQCWRLRRLEYATDGVFLSSAWMVRTEIRHSFAGLEFEIRLRS